MPALPLRRPDVAGLLAVAVGVALGFGVSLLLGASLGTSIFVAWVTGMVLCALIFTVALLVARGNTRGPRRQA